MSQHSPQSSAGRGPASSPFAGTDPTLYSPELARDTKHRRDNASIATVVGRGKAVDTGVVFEKAKILPQPEPYVQGAFVNEMSENAPDFISRFQLVTQLPDRTSAGMDQEHELFSVQHQMKLYACFSTCIPVYTRGVYLRYDDLREAAEGKDILTQHDFAVDYVSGYQYALAKTQDTAQLNEFEGQIQLSVMIDANPDHAIWEFSNTDYTVVRIAVENICRAFGPYRNLVHVETINDKMLLVFRVEFHSVDAANRAVHSLSNDPVWGINSEKSFQWITVNPCPWAGERAINSPHRTKPRVDDQGRFVGYRPAVNSLPVENFYRHPQDQHNRVRRDNILDGTDVRTTIMLRNIPNKVDWLALKAILDAQCFGTYDFVYLRIDFKTGCNVGYAFINFANVHGMIALIDNIERRCWLGYRSTKAAEISYATIQGREALIQKFRNSSVMQETPFCRPRLFLTYTDSEVIGKLRSTGTEQVFPRPDNLSKLQRSMDSARTIGLFPPHGYSSLGEHRNRGTGYDRGSPRDILQAAMNFARQRAAPAPAAFQELTPDTKHDIELWYTRNYGQGRLGCIPFDFIPLTHLTMYFAQQQQANPQAMASNIGVIGGPAYGFNQADPFGKTFRGILCGAH
ncbi:RNA recognition motif 2-domain-containing protein [Ampelomyces quisqualis]|uniref:RNA recognition motif 2-domain-containing protein n=1 Tax=Ampelomyces quisqualis TaxID=50730 RepID=A0A6A5QJ67_AMPQU|nr:RNA recognition motif 2-domain-containing protein [Ampelomyces quisqualis]